MGTKDGRYVKNHDDHLDQIWHFEVWSGTGSSTQVEEGLGYDGVRGPTHQTGCSPVDPYKMRC